MSWTDDFLTGLAEFLDEIGAGTWRPNAAGGTIAKDTLPDEIANGIGISAYNLRPDVDLSDVVQPVQFWIRGDSAFVKATADTLFSELHGVTHLVIAGIRCPLVSMQSDVSMGVDAKGRRERAVNYAFSLNRPTASRPD